VTPCRAVLYARVSKGKDQNPETQLAELRDWAQRTGTSAEEFVDELSSRDRRPQKEEVLRRVRLGLVDTVVVVRLDRWGRSMDELVTELDEFSKRKVAFVSLREGLRFDDAAGRLFGHMLAAFASFERDLIRERTVAGLSLARSEGKAGGRHPVGCGCGARPIGRPPHDGDVLPIRDPADGKRVVGWRWPDGRESRARSNAPRPEGGSSTPTEGSPSQTPVRTEAAS
jgi:putative DNA-invertase from lambdoid prophage Rac